MTPIGPYFHWTNCSNPLLRIRARHTSEPGVVLKQCFHHASRVGYQLHCCCPHSGATHKQLSGSSHYMDRSSSVWPRIRRTLL